MRRNEIPLRVVLARQTNYGAQPNPVAVIDMTTMWSKAGTVYAPAEGWRYSAYGSVRVGYLVIQPNHQVRKNVEDRVRLMEAWVQSLPEKLTADLVNALGRDLPAGPHGLQLGVANSRDLLRTWERNVAARAERERLTQEQHEREQARMVWEMAVRDALRKHDLPITSVSFGVSSSYVNMERSTLDRLLGIEAS